MPDKDIVTQDRTYILGDDILSISISNISAAPHLEYPQVNRRIYAYVDEYHS